MPATVDSVSKSFRDQYADGKAAKLFDFSRTENYKKFLLNLLRSKGCKRILDAACGTGVDSIMLLEEGFEVVSVDASAIMLKCVLTERWNRRREAAFENWVIEEANWLTLYDDLNDIVGDGFDAVICMGNSFAHLMDSFGDQREHKQAIRNLEKCLKPGGMLVIDHRNYENILGTDFTPAKNLYFISEQLADIKTSVLLYCGKPAMVTIDYLIRAQNMTNDLSNEFRLSYYPHALKTFSKMLQDIFGPKSTHKIFADFKALSEVERPVFYIHLMEKA